MRRPPAARAEPIDAAAFDHLFAGLALAQRGVLAAVSGGPDSTALMYGLAEWARAPGRPCVTVATVDHGLREESAAEAAAVGRAAQRLGLSHRILAWSPPAAGRVSQEYARKARYHLLADLAHEIGASDLVTAHTLDDQAETVLMRAAAGSGLAGLGGMRTVVARGALRHVRPLLNVPKARLVATCRANDWAFVEDPSNADRRYARSRLRQLAPVLAAEGLDAGRICRLAARLRRADEALDSVAATVFARLRGDPAGDVIRLDAVGLAAEPIEIALRVLALGLREPCPGPVTESPPIRLERLEACLAGLLGALAAGRAERRTLAGRRIELDPAGRIGIRAEAPRRRGSARVTEIAAAAPHSLGIPGLHA